MQARKFLLRHNPELQLEFDKRTPSKENYITNLKKAMEIESLEDLVGAKDEYNVSISLKYAVRRAMSSVIAFWDVSGGRQEFIVPKIPEITKTDNISIFHKSMVLQKRKYLLVVEWMPGDLDLILQRLQIGSISFTENYSTYPISPTRCIVYFSPYFRAFFLY